MAYIRIGGNGIDTSDATATASDILSTKTAYVNGTKITGSMANNGAISATINPGASYTVPSGYTSGGTITATNSGGATITVTYDSQFYNKTMTCTKGTTTYTETTTSSGSTVFDVDSSGTWTITCNGVSRTVEVVLEYTIQMAITKTITVYSAASDTVSFTDVTGAKTVTTNTSGQGSVSISFIPNSTITFTSSVAKNPNNLTAYYSKNVNLTNSTSEIYLMPDKVIYWWGYEPVTMTQYTDAYGGAITRNTRDITIGKYSSTAYNASMLYRTYDLTSANTMYMVTKYSDTASYMQWLCYTDTEAKFKGASMTAYTNITPTTSMAKSSVSVSGATGTQYIGYFTNCYPTTTYIYALWLE